MGWIFILRPFYNEIENLLWRAADSIGDAQRMI